LASDPLYPVIVRSTALSLLAAYPGEETSRAYERALLDDEALIRRTAVDHLSVPDPRRQAELLTAMLYDPVTAVRIEAARRMAEGPDPALDASSKKSSRRRSPNTGRPWNTRPISRSAATTWGIFIPA
jgi:HEAT repeat protein